MNDYRKKTAAELDFIMRDAAAAALAMRDHSPAAERKYLDQLADAETERRRRHIKPQQIQLT